MPLPSPQDEAYLPLSRAHIMAHLRRHLDPMPNGKVLEIGPKLDWPGFDTLDIDPLKRATWTADITKFNRQIPPSTYDLVLCISVLEHTLDPFAAVEEIRRLLKPGGMLLAQAPFNFRIHGPLPDCWRFTEHGWRVLLKDWDEVTVEPLEAPDRALAPITYAVTALCNKLKRVDAESLAPWRWIE